MSNGQKQVVAPERPRWAERSRSSVEMEARLEKDLQRRQSMRRSAEQTLTMLNEEKQRLLGFNMAGEAWAGDGLTRLITNIGIAETKLSLFKEEEKKSQENLDAFRADVAARAPWRAQMQDNIAELVGALVRMDRENQPLVDQVYKKLKARQEVCALIRSSAAKIELSYDFEAGIPASFIESLHFDMAAASQAWKALFLGESDALKAYVVCDDSLEPQPTLARKAVYSFGETVLLSEDEARELVRDDRPIPGRPRWDCLPPSLMMAEDFAVVRAEYRGPNALMKHYVRQRHAELTEKRRREFVPTFSGTAVRVPETSVREEKIGTWRE